MYVNLIGTTKPRLVAIFLRASSMVSEEKWELLMYPPQTPFYCPKKEF